MKIAKLFSNGRSQAVRLPKECRFGKGEKEVYIRKVEGIIMLIPKRNPWGSLAGSLDKFTDDYLQERNQPRERDSRESLG